MKSIDTYYNGNYHRSRLEARWAHFFKILGVPYVYEPEGFKSDKGEMYLPDFYLPETWVRNKEKGVYLEIKPENYDRDVIPAFTWFQRPLILFCGPPAHNIWDSPYWADSPYDVLGRPSGYEGGFEHSFWDTPIIDEEILELLDDCMGWDNYMLFWRCSECGATKIEFSEGNYDYCPNETCREKRSGEFGYRDKQLNKLSLIEAAVSAQKIRFEHLKSKSIY